MLGPHVVGQRVVVRRLLPDGRATDLLGTCLAWSEVGIVVQPASGAPVTIPLTDLITGKPVPPRASIRDRVSPRDAQVHGFALFPDLITTPLGKWVLRDSPTATARRANSVLAFGPSGVDGDVDAVLAHYERPVAAVLADSEEEARFRGLGWVPESTEADTLFMVTATAQLARRLGRRVAREERAGVSRRPAAEVVEVRGPLGPSLESPDPELVEAQGPPGPSLETPQLVTATIPDTASGVAAYADDWLGIRDLRVDDAHRRRGLATQILAELVEWGAEQGAHTVYLQVLADNEPALALYEQLGFRTHHAYRYLTPR